MPDPTDTDNQQDDDQESPVIRDLRKKAKEADRFAVENAQLKKDLILHQAGLNSLSEKQLKALTAAHDGDWTSDGIKATATELGFYSTPQPAASSEPENSPDPAMQRVDAATGTPAQPPPDLDAKIRAATTPGEVMALLAQNNLLAD